MKKSPVLITFLGIFALTSCDFGVTPVAYTTFKNDANLYVCYSTDMYGLTRSHIEVYQSKEAADEQYAIADLDFRFDRILGPDEVDGQKYTLVDLSSSIRDIYVNVYKSSPLYSASKHIYLNDVQLTPVYTYDGDTLLSWTFEKANFIRTNPNGKLDYSLVNVLEYK